LYCRSGWRGQPCNDHSVPKVCPNHRLWHNHGRRSKECLRELRGSTGGNARPRDLRGTAHFTAWSELVRHG
jgi:hypothetical protein